MTRRGMILTAAALAAVAFGLWRLTLPGGAPATPASAAVVQPELTPALAEGRDLFEANCAKCHGENGTGTENGPPFLHRFYVPGHHGDFAFQMAVRQGVQPHHWRFGPMPPVPGLSEADVNKITAYVRALQRANGFE